MTKSKWDLGKHPDRIQYFRGPLVEFEEGCPICGQNKSSVALEVEFEGNRLQMRRCECESLFYPGRVAPNYGEVEGHDSFWMRIDQAEGIDATIRPIFLSSELNGFPVVDIGCGMGFSSDFIRHQNRSSIAFDPSSAAKMSNDILGINIIQDFAQPELVQFSGPRLVYASEVVEHVDHPKEFLGVISKIAGNEGFAILTTPNAEYISNRADQSTVRAMLAPSQHLFLFSASALSAICKDAGFSWVRVLVENERLIVICGPREVSIDDSFSRNDFIEYLQGQLANENIDYSVRIRSFGYRLFKELLHSARYAESLAVLEKLTEAYSGFGFNLNSPEDIVKRFKDCLKSSFTLPPAEKYPFNLAILMYLIGTLKIAHYRDRKYAFRYFRAARTLSNFYGEIFSVNGIFAAYDLEIQFVASWSRRSILLHSPIIGIGFRNFRKLIGRAKPK